MNYQWHKEKAQANVKKHGVRFADAATVFDDDLCLTLEDDAAEGEARYITLGRDNQGRLLVVVWCFAAGDYIRLISARQATTHERKTYSKEAYR
jgi:uncharacterized DUF497 family protein